MATYLRVTAIAVGIFGLLVGIGFARVAYGDAEFELKRKARERNLGNVLFETEFRVAEARRLFLVYSSTAGFLVAIVGGSTLWGLGALHARLDGERPPRRGDG
jgi:hypothetical protein